MNFKRAATLVSCTLVFTCAFAQVSMINLDALNTDMGTLFSGLGADLSPSINAVARSGDSLVGAAELPGKSGIYVSFLGLGVTSMDGVGKVLGTSDADTWKFQLLPIPSLITSALGASDTSVTDTFSTITQKAFALPSIRMGFGFPLPGGFEVLANGFFLPNALLTWGVGIASKPTVAMLDAVGASVTMLTLGGNVRKVFLSEKRDKKLPALSMGVGYTYSLFDLGADQFSLEAVGVEPMDVGGLGTLAMDGSVSFVSKVHAASVNLAVSKTLLYFFRPFLKTTASFYHSTYNSTFAVTAKVNPTAAVVAAAALAGTSVPVIEQELAAPVTIVRDDLSLFVTTGFELAFPVFIITFAGTVDMEQPVLNIKEFTFNGIGFLMSMRLQF